MYSPSRPILIVGAGIAGLTSALCLAPMGWPILLIERKTSLNETGLGLQLSPNASRIYAKLGLQSAIEQVAVAPENLSIHRWKDGKILHSASLEKACQIFDAPFWNIARSDLQTILLDAIRSHRNIRLLLGRTIESCLSHRDHVVLRLHASSKESEEIEGHALIGADGLWSQIRSLIQQSYSQEKIQPRFSGYEAWRARMPAKEMDPFFSMRSTQLWIGKEAHLVHYPIAKGEWINLVLVRETKERLLPEDLPTNRRGIREENSHSLQPLLHTMPPQITKALQQVPSWKIWPLYDGFSSKTWTKGRIILIGDAAHPILPFLAQGAGLAIEDAGDLAENLTHAPEQIERVFANFVMMRKKRARRILWASRLQVFLYHQAGIIGLIRNYIFLKISPHSLLNRYAWIYRWGQRL